MTLDHPVASSLRPVVLLIGIGFAAGRLKLIRGEPVARHALDVGFSLIERQST